jgi:hypothetical protein
LVQKLEVGDRQTGDLISLLLFLESRLKREHEGNITKTITLNKGLHVISKVFTARWKKIVVFWAVVPCSILEQQLPTKVSISIIFK